MTKRIKHQGPGMAIRQRLMEASVDASELTKHGSLGDRTDQQAGRRLRLSTTICCWRAQSWRLPSAWFWFPARRRRAGNELWALATGFQSCCANPIPSSNNKQTIRYRLLPASILRIWFCHARGPPHCLSMLPSRVYRELLDQCQAGSP
jgi:hypothetical protein